ncbi:SDR family NAD(P)-dependent oxidoreductase [Streptomyces sp. NK08204]|uniref:SDR family NAD(P)-dependent oxidoreductase n=1 Tax=Streptomyces sp. NK08204 TaxID=2873260 RepID=UPI001CEE03A1|nr:SDR family NAD(P)-dependent oxidoreductase [Streptomyces sp. NK08204]
MPQVAIIAGTGTDTAASAALVLAQDGFDVALLDADESARTATADQVKSLGRRVMAVRTDWTDGGSAGAAIEQVCADLGDPSVLLTVVSVADAGQLSALSQPQWTDATAAPLRAVFLACQAVLDPMTMNGGGRIITIADPGGAEGENATVRTALEGLTRTLALELAPLGITANLLTPLLPVDQLGTRAARTPTAAEFAAQAARTVSMLAGTAAASLTGQVLRVGP